MSNLTEVAQQCGTSRVREITGPDAAPATDGDDQTLIYCVAFLL